MNEMREHARRTDGPDYLRRHRRFTDREADESNAAVDVPGLDTAEMAPKDPWAHRTAGMRCSSCMWFVAKPSPTGTRMLGRCRRRCPTMNGYPAVFDTDWCGDHKLDENK